MSDALVVDALIVWAFGLILVGALFTIALIISDDDRWSDDE